MMDAEPLLLPLADEHRPVVERLWQLYSHDMSEVRETLPNAEGLYKEGRLPGYFGDPDRAGYLISYRETPVGLAFVQGLAGETRMIAEFFVVRAVRRHGIGRKVATELLGRHPGRWEIPFQGGNRGAPEFWRQVASDVVGSDWREERRPVPNKPHIPHDQFILFTNG